MQGFSLPCKDLPLMITNNSDLQQNYQFIYLFIYLFNFIYTRVKTSGLKGNTKITLIILSKYLSTTKLNLMTVKNKNNNKIKCLLSMNAV